MKKWDIGVSNEREDAFFRRVHFSQLFHPGACTCRRGEQRDNCPVCEGTGQRIDFRAIREKGIAASQLPDTDKPETDLGDF